MGWRELLLWRQVSNLPMIVGWPNRQVGNLPPQQTQRVTEGGTMTALFDQVQEAAATVRGRWACRPLVGPNDDRLGPRFPDMCRPYDPQLLELTRRVALEERIVCQQGVFAAVAGPNLETRAEYRFLRQGGADAVGMSTVPEVIVAVHAGLRTVGFSIVTDMCLPDALEPADVAKIIATANAAEPNLTKLVLGVLAEEKA